MDPGRGCEGWKCGTADVCVPDYCVQQDPRPCPAGKLCIEDDPSGYNCTIAHCKTPITSSNLKIINKPLILLQPLDSAKAPGGQACQPDGCGLSFTLQPCPAGLTCKENDENDVCGGGGTCVDTGSLHSLPALAGIDIFFVYFNTVWPWVLGVAAGIAILQAMVGGLQIMLSGGSEQRSAGEERLKWALGGLALVALAGFLLRVLNPIFFK